jgi:hypothetical protein
MSGSRKIRRDRQSVLGRSGGIGTERGVSCFRELTDVWRYELGKLTGWQLLPRANGRVPVAPGFAEFRHTSQQRDESARLSRPGAGHLIGTDRPTGLHRPGVLAGGCASPFPPLERGAPMGYPEVGCSGLDFCRLGSPMYRTDDVEDPPLLARPDLTCTSAVTGPCDGTGTLATPQRSVRRRADVKTISASHPALGIKRIGGAVRHGAFGSAYENAFTIGVAAGVDVGAHFSRRVHLPTNSCHGAWPHRRQRAKLHRRTASRPLNQGGARA